MIDKVHHVDGSWSGNLLKYRVTIIQFPALCFCVCMGWNFWGKSGNKNSAILRVIFRDHKFSNREQSQSHICHFLPLLFMIQAIARHLSVKPLCSNLVLVTPYLHHFLHADISCLEAVCSKWHFAGGNWPEITKTSCTFVHSGALSILLRDLLAVAAVSFEWFIEAIRTLSEVDSSVWFVMDVGSGKQSKLFINETSYFFL